MANLFYLKGKKYNCYVSGKPYFRTSVTINGKVHQVYGDGEKDARRKIEELKSQADKGINLDYRKAKVGEVMETWLYDIKRLDRNLKATSFANYESKFRLYIKPYPISQLTLQNFTRTNVQKYVLQLVEENRDITRTLDLALMLLKMFAKWALEEDIIAKDPCRGVVIPGKYNKTQKTFDIFSEEERELLLRYMRETHYWYDTLIQLAFATGMRKGELLALKWEDIYDGAIHVRHSTAAVTYIDGKGNRRVETEVWEPKTVNAFRTIPLLGSTQKMLDGHKAKQAKYFLAHGLGRPEFVFTTNKGTLISHQILHTSYKALLRRAGLEYRKFHAIRHTFATEAIRRGVNVKDLQALMGHSNIAMTYRYVQSDENSARNAIERLGAMM